MRRKKKAINREVQILLLGLLPELYCYARKQNSNENFTNTALSFDDLTDMPEQADYRTVEHNECQRKKGERRECLEQRTTLLSTIY